MKAKESKKQFYWIVTQLLVASISFAEVSSVKVPHPVTRPSPKTPPEGMKPKKSKKSETKASETKATETFPLILKEIEEEYSKKGTLSANFIQLNENPALQQKKTTVGKLMVKIPDKVRWETEKPDQNLLIGDGKRFWYYTPPFDETERGQYIEKKSSQVQSKFASAILSGSFSGVKNMKTVQKSSKEFILYPKKRHCRHCQRSDDRD